MNIVLSLIIMASTYEIFESAERGYVVNVYSDEDGEYLDKYLVDGGLCSGTVKDAIEFML